MLRFRVVAVLLLFVAACAPAPQESLDGDWPDRSPRFDVVEELRADLQRPRSAADGGGTATVEALRGPAVAGSPGSWRIVYRAGPAGVAVGGTVHLQVSPFWGWSTPQTERREALGYTTIETAATGVELSAETLDQQLLAIGVGGRPLAAGEEVVITYGAGPAGALADRYAERESRFWVAVDGDGDGVRELIGESPAVDVMPGAAGAVAASPALDGPAWGPRRAHRGAGRRRGERLAAGIRDGGASPACQRRPGRLEGRFRGRSGAARLPGPRPRGSRPPRRSDSAFRGGRWCDQSAWPTGGRWVGARIRSGKQSAGCCAGRPAHPVGRSPEPLRPLRRFGDAGRPAALRAGGGRPRRRGGNRSRPLGHAVHGR